MHMPALYNIALFMPSLYSTVDRRGSDVQREMPQRGTGGGVGMQHAT